MGPGHRWRGDLGFTGLALLGWAIAEWFNVLDDHLPVSADAMAAVFGTLFGLGAAAYVFAVMLPSADFATHLAKEHHACPCHSSLDNLRFVFQWQVFSAIVGLFVCMSIMIFQAPDPLVDEAALAARGALSTSMAVAIKICYDLIRTLSQLGQLWEKWLLRPKPRQPQDQQ